ncbi:MAG TPA: hypothetical protein VM536_11430 [Chloroflexia bacterium]|nr:hypothetical protein [Chloroflexia bacterium]
MKTPAAARTLRLTLALGLLATLGATWVAQPTAAAALRFGDGAFERVWVRTDGPVAAGQAGRSWYWGPAPGMIVREPYAGLPGGSHLVQYFDKSRMEINDPNGDRNAPWFVTNGLLTGELIAGRVQIGLTQYEERAPAQIPLASDTDDTTAPTYASFLPVSNTSRGDHPAADRTGGSVTAVINRAGAVSNDAGRALQATILAHYEPKTHHNIPGVFWSYLTASGPVRETTRLVTAPLSDPWNFATGLPISEAYWARVKIAGTAQWVLIQAYERRVLTYVPANEPQWRVQMGNIGQHYYRYRYGDAAATLAGAVTRVAAAPSYHVESLVQLQTPRLLVPFARQAGDVQAPDRTHFIQQSTDGISEVVTIGPTLYLSSTQTGGQWQKMSGGNGGTLDIAGLVGILQYATHVTAAPDEPVGGVPARHLHMTLDPAQIPTLSGVTYASAEGDLYLATATGLPLRLRVTLPLAAGSIQQGTILATIDFSAYGKPVQIAPPIP